MASMYLGSPVMVDMRAKTGGAMKRASHHHQVRRDGGRVLGEVGEGVVEAWLSGMIMPGWPRRA